MYRSRQRLGVGRAGRSRGQKENMGAIDAYFEGFLEGHAGLGIILLISLFLGLRHASDPDHLAAVTTLIASEEERERARKAGLMGFFWGLGHGTTLLILGLPLVLFNRFLPEPVQQVAEVAIGAIIVALAVRLLLRWQRGFYHVHTHARALGYRPRDRFGRGGRFAPLLARDPPQPGRGGGGALVFGRGTRRFD